MAGKKKIGTTNRLSTGKRTKPSTKRRRPAASVERKVSAPRFSQEEILFVRKRIAKAPNAYDRMETREAVKLFDKANVDFLVFQLGVVDFYKDRSGRAHASYYDFGKGLWNNCRQQLRDAICGDSETYQQERARLHSGTESAIIVLIPLVLSALKLPPEASGVAIVISLMILKIGLKAFCATAGDLTKLRGKPGQICSATGRYLNIRDGKIEVVFKGSHFPQGLAKSEWVFFEEVAGS